MNKKIEFPTQLDLEKFISDEAHDLRSPFSQVVGFTKMLINTMGTDPIADTQKEDLNTVYRGGMRALNMMNGLIDAARINRHEKTINLSDASLKKVLDNGIAQWKKYHPGADAEVEAVNETGVEFIHSDEQLLQQLVIGMFSLTAVFCEAKFKLNLKVNRSPRDLTFHFTSKGTKTRLPSALDLNLFGFVNRSLLESLGGSITLAEETDDGAVIQMTIPG